MESFLCQHTQTHKKYFHIHECDVVFFLSFFIFLNAGATKHQRQWWWWGQGWGWRGGTLLSESDFQGHHFNRRWDRNEWHQIEKTHTLTCCSHTIATIAGTHPISSSVLWRLPSIKSYCLSLLGSRNPLGSPVYSPGRCGASQQQADEPAVFSLLVLLLLSLRCFTPGERHISLILCTFQYDLVVLLSGILAISGRAAGIRKKGEIVQNNKNNQMDECNLCSFLTGW